MVRCQIGPGRRGLWWLRSGIYPACEERDLQAREAEEKNRGWIVECEGDGEV